MKKIFRIKTGRDSTLHPFNRVQWRPKWKFWHKWQTIGNFSLYSHAFSAMQDLEVREKENDSRN